MVDVAIFGAAQRCGSTMVQRIFNLREKTMVWGENGRLLKYFQGARVALDKFSVFGQEEREAYLTSERSSDVFTANMNPPAESNDRILLEALRTFFVQMYTDPKYDVVGFKEVELDIDAVGLFLDLFPKSKIYLIARNPYDSWRSLYGWGLTVPTWMDLWYANVAGYLAWEAEGQAELLWYEDILEGTETRRLLADAAEVPLESVNQLIDGPRVGATPSNQKQLTPSIEIDYITLFLSKLPADDPLTQQMRRLNAA